MKPFLLILFFLFPFSVDAQEIKFDADKWASEGLSWLNKKFLDSNKYHDKKDMWIFFEGNNCGENVVGSMWGSMNGRKELNVKKVDWFKNDEARSVLIQNGVKGETIRIYDNPDGKTNDDWLQITIKKTFTGAYAVNSLEIGGFEDEYVKLIYHRKNGLSGKVSHVKNF